MWTVGEYDWWSKKLKTNTSLDQTSTLESKMEDGINSQVERIFVILLVIIFGSGSWITISGVWSEIPVLVALGLPEKNRITSYITILVQSGLFVGVVPFLICNKFLASTRVYRPEIPFIYPVIFTGTIGTFLLIFFWDSRTYLSGQPHSVAFIIIIFFVATVDMTMNITSIGYISLLKPEYLNWLLIGQGMGFFLPAWVVLIQHSGGSKETCVANFTFMNETVVGNSSLSYSCTSWREVAPEFLFGPEQFFAFLFAMMLSCHISFICLNTLPCTRREYTPQRDGHHLKKMAAEGFSNHGTPLRVKWTNLWVWHKFPRQRELPGRDQTGGTLRWENLRIGRLHSSMQWPL